MYLRSATISDAELLLEWANDSLTRQNSFNTHRISREEHYAWLRRVLSSEDTDIFILCDKEPVGTIRLHYNKKNAEISYSIGAEFRGKGYGLQIIRLAEIEAIKYGVKNIIAEVKKDNFPSQRIFEKLCYNKTEINACFQYCKQCNGVIGFRVDANAQIATGHAMRCVTYAKELMKQGKIVVFFVADDISKAFIESKGMYAAVLNTDNERLDTEIQVFTEQLNFYGVKTLVIDSYHVTENYLSSLKGVVKTVYIDDLLSFAYPVDAIINYAVYANQAEYVKLYGGNCPKLFLGTQYAPLREEFKDTCYVAHNGIKNILITMGGSDRFNVALSIAEGLLSEETFSDITIHLVVGSFYSTEIYNDKIIVYKDVSNMAQLMAGCDLVISAGGFTLYEAQAIGVPTISVLTADNQRRNVEKFAELNLIPYMGDFMNNKQAVIESIKQYIQKRI